METIMDGKKVRETHTEPDQITVIINQKATVNLKVKKGKLFLPII
jgi:hypothetical protein